MEGKKESAVEFYEKKLTKLLISLENNEISIGVFAVKKFELFGKAKQLEKEQIIESYNQGICDSPMERKDDAEQYYELVYGNK
jgi:hypothetical protein